MPSTIFSGSKVKALKKILSLNGGAEIHSGTTDPTSSAVDAPIGTIYQHETTGALYKKLDAGSSTNWELVGSGAGGDKSYATGNDSTADTALGTKWTTFDDGAYPPVDGSGGTVTATFARTTSSPLQGAGSMLFTPGGQYDAIAFGFTIDRADFARIHKIKFDYEIGTSSSYTDGDVKLAVICASDSGFTTDLQVIQPAGHSILKVGGQETHVATFQSHASNLYYRVCLVQTTASTGYTVKFDNFKVGPQSVAYGCPVSDWASYTPTFTGFGTPSSVFARWRRVGDSIQIECSFTSGTVTAVEARVSFPSGITSAGSDRIGTLDIAGNYACGNATGDNYYVFCEQSVTYVTFGRASLSKVTASSVFNSSEGQKFIAVVPILGWSSNVVVSDSADTRVVAAILEDGGTSVSDGGTAVQSFSATPELDTHGGFNGTNTYTVKVPGLYDVSAFGVLVLATSTNYYFTLELLRNGSTTGIQGRSDGNTGTASTIASAIMAGSVYCNAGDTLTLRAGQQSGASRTPAALRLQLKRVSGPAQIASSESIEAEASGSSQTITTSDTTIVATTVEFDSHGSYSNSTGKFTAQISGKYEAILHASSAGLTFSGTNRAWYARIRKTAVGGGTTDTTIGYTSNGTTTSHNLNLDKSVRVKLLAGESLEWRTSHDTQITDFTMDQVRVGFRKIGNY